MTARERPLHVGGMIDRLEVQNFKCVRPPDLPTAPYTHSRRRSRAYQGSVVLGPHDGSEPITNGRESPPEHCLTPTAPRLAPLPMLRPSGFPLLAQGGALRLYPCRSCGIRVMQHHPTAGGGLCGADTRGEPRDGPSRGQRFMAATPGVVSVKHGGCLNFHRTGCALAVCVGWRDARRTLERQWMAGPPLHHRRRRLDGGGVMQRGRVGVCGTAAWRLWLIDDTVRRPQIIQEEAGAGPVQAVHRRHRAEW